MVDTNSSQLALALEAAGIHVKRMISLGDDKTEIATILSRELSQNALVISTGGLGPTKDDITKAVLGEISGAKGMVTHPGQLEMVHKILQNRGLDVLPSNLAQAEVPDTAEVIVNQLGTAPIMVFRNVRGGGTLYALPGVPHEAVGAIPAVMDDIRSHQPLDSILHRNIMVYGIAESALSEKIAPWEDALPADMHLAYLPNPLTGIRLRLSIYGGNAREQDSRMEAQLAQLKNLLGPLAYADKDSDLETTIGELLKAAGKTLSAAESCTGGVHRRRDCPPDYFRSRFLGLLPGIGHFLCHFRERSRIGRPPCHYPGKRRGEQRSSRRHGRGRPPGYRQRLRRFYHWLGGPRRRCIQPGGNRMDWRRRSQGNTHRPLLLQERPQTQYRAFCGLCTQFSTPNPPGRVIVLIHNKSNTNVKYYNICVTFC